MGRPATNFAGCRVGRWSVLDRAGSTKSGAATWNCLCACGSRRVVNGAHLSRGVSTSCGCYRDELARELMLKLATTHGASKSEEYVIWHGMRQRCNNPNNSSYANYGGRGVAVCKEWDESFEAFLEDVGPRPSKNHSLGRLNNDLGYCPENVVWQTDAEQRANQRPRVRNSQHDLVVATLRARIAELEAELALLRPLPQAA